MLGASLDYQLLRRLTHCGQRATEAELDARFGDLAAAPAGEAAPKLRKLVERFAGHLPLDPGRRYLDLGCGTGELTVALAELSGGTVTGVDFLPRSIERARAWAEQHGAGERVRFICQDLHTWQPAADERFDVLLSFDAFEHIEQPRAFLERMAGLLAPGGVAVLAFGPLFHSPFGDHMGEFFRVQLPWRGVLFAEDSLLRLRRECYRPTDPARRYRDIAGGLNQLRYSEFLRDVRVSGWVFDYLAANTFLRPGTLLRRLSDTLMRWPGVQDYLAHNVYAVLRRAPLAVDTAKTGILP